MKGLSESLAGSVSILEMTTLSMRELFLVKTKLPFIPTEDYFREREKQMPKYHDVWSYIHNGFHKALFEVAGIVNKGESNTSSFTCDPVLSECVGCAVSEANVYAAGDMFHTAAIRALKRSHLNPHFSCTVGSFNNV